MTVVLIALLPIFGAVLPLLAAPSGRSRATAVTFAVTAASLFLLLAQAPAVLGGATVAGGSAWLPDIGLGFTFLIDGLGLFFAGIILTIGLLIVVYAGFYLGRDDDPGRFFCFLLLFQGAMLGVVLSDNILLLAIFWELTSLTSFLLIGFWHHRPEGRQGARMALIVTGSGGLALLAGMLLLGQAAGSYELSEILTRVDQVRASPLFGPILALVLAGAFTKSAQFPVHFWLPHAMAAPTPVSAYLHSATMVKAGLFLMLRLWPLFAGTEAWFLVVSGTGLATMVIAARIALAKDDLKAILAYSTVSHLGLITFLIGLGTRAAVVAAVFHIFNHAAFKAALFMTAGIVDHETGTRDIRRLGGLARLMPVTAVIGTVAAAAMAGVPLLNGFLSKEMMLEAAAGTSYLGNPWIVAAVATLAALYSVAYALRFVHATFFGRSRLMPGGHPHDPPAGMWLPAALLVTLSVAVGVLPQVIAGDLVAATAAAVTGPQGPAPEVHLALWHGVTAALSLSLVAFAGGAARYALSGWVDRFWPRDPIPDAKALFDAALAGLVGAARFVTDRIHTGTLQRALSATVLAILAVGAAAFAGSGHAAGTRPPLPPDPATIAGVLALAGATLAVPLMHRDRLLALMLTAVAGLAVSLLFLRFSAPDLALTQIAVEVVAGLLLLLVLNLLPKTSPAEPSRLRLMRDAALAGLGGIAVAGLAYAVMTRDGSSIAAFHLAESKPLGGGTNVVNVILVDFRGFDTFGEIIVLGIAALVVVALLDTALRGRAARRLDRMRRTPAGGDRHPLLLAMATRVLLPLALATGLFIFLRGHNLPGGGFVAGLVVAIAILMQSMANGYAWTAGRMTLDAHALIGAGVLIAGATGLAALAFGAPFLTSSFGHFHLPLVGDIELASAMGFDLGVFLTVVGVVLLALSRIARIEARAEDRRPNRGAIAEPATEDGGR
ncbi:cation:proton antiporter [Prosthecomicrobium hirschii]|uniref:Cation:proton antiporter n=1 Tax=Prosthecodimorpha hirschii TaxID=665126 RepID=A0A0P6VL82_9HYPH|nr:monovalent cation/H+ antiporter subunit A [Prosthecomicrobium hirschii]KPL51951.1 cation:proton antiporter [Prosthecomicrobium hirschii]